MSKAIMIQGTSSSAGKSFIVTGLCRIFRQDGFTVAPFKSQNMALNSFITKDGLEMGRAQVAQAEAAGAEPSVLMNPLLLKPTGDACSQVILNGEVFGNIPAAEYYRRKPEFYPHIERAFKTLSDNYDVVVIEGAGSPAEINLLENDIVNMGVAKMTGAPVLLVGDIDRGGVFASLYGTLALLPPEDRDRVRGCVINKFRGDVEILRPGLKQLEDLAGVPILGVVPHLKVYIDDEDSLSDRIGPGGIEKKLLDCAVVRLPRMSNFTDFSALDRHPAIGVRYVDNANRLGRPDFTIIPGSKNTQADLLWLRQSGFEAQLKHLTAEGMPLVGICGGFQMLGESISDPFEVEGGGEVRGMELLPIRTVFEMGKVRARVKGRILPLKGYFSFLSGCAFEGYEIHMGTSQMTGAGEALSEVTGLAGDTPDGVAAGRVFGSYVHGIFDSGELGERLAWKLLSERGLSLADATPLDQTTYKERQYNLLAESLREALDMKRIYGIMGLQ